MTNDYKTLKIADFGLSIISSEPLTSYAIVGTPEFVAPEVWMQIPIDAAIDLWSVGVLLYEMLLGKTPYKATTEALREILHTRHLNMVPENSMSPEMASLINNLLQHSRYRMEFDEFLETVRDMDIPFVIEPPKHKFRFSLDCLFGYCDS